ncbi:Sec-independent protein translocase subunit TatA/TatB [Nocardia caishijiensis]|uniref:Sec-independent protein translocase protein TatB n=1 Tax=Nocardia caishijiensis TaxID=184756 RepID=A0ABQ6YSN2_9NOCA|nr:preprotein translocase [Nocardia caishijiensis]KAF0848721.1 sec-independent protein translocase protein TatB [Nocardia caishijiensis]
MFGLTFEKLFLVAVVAGFVLGPARLPGYANQLARTVRALREFVETQRTAAEREIGVPLQRSEWESLRRYDPRRIVGDALRDPVDVPAVDDNHAAAARVRPGQQYLVTGTTAHPRRVRIDSLPDDDPRRVAARSVDMVPVSLDRHDEAPRW